MSDIRYLFDYLNVLLNRMCLGLSEVVENQLRSNEE